MFPCKDFIEHYERALTREPHELVRSNLFNLVQHPRFAEAAQESRKICAAYLEQHSNRSDLSKLATFTIGQLIVYFHVRRKLKRAPENNSVQKIKSYLKDNSISSGRHVTNVIPRLVDTGEVVRKVSPQDQRVHWLVPTDHLMRSGLDFAECVLAPLTYFGFPRELLQRLETDKLLQEAFVYESCKSHLSGCDGLTPFAVVKRMMTKSRGFLLLCQLGIETYDLHGSLYLEKPIPLNTSQRAEACRASRSQLRILIEDLSRSGHIILDQGKNELTVTRALAVQMECSTAGSMIVHENALLQALTSPLLSANSSP